MLEVIIATGTEKITVSMLLGHISKCKREREEVFFKVGSYKTFFFKNMLCSLS